MEVEQHGETSAMQEATTRAAEGSAQRPPAPALCSVCSVIKDPAKHMGGKEVVVGPASIVMCDQAERMDIAAGDVPCVHLRGRKLRARVGTRSRGQRHAHAQSLKACFAHRRGQADRANCGVERQGEALRGASRGMRHRTRDEAGVCVMDVITCTQEPKLRARARSRARGQARTRESERVCCGSQVRMT